VREEISKEFTAKIEAMRAEFRKALDADEAALDPAPGQIRRAPDTLGECRPAQSPARRTRAAAALGNLDAAAPGRLGSPARAFPLAFVPLAAGPTPAVFHFAEALVAS
jgi:hypothetical protein